MELVIDSEFKALIPPLSPSEYEQLRDNILEAGEIRDALVTWDGIILDGHNRYEIANDYGIEFRVKEMEFESRAAATIWIVNNQLGRRNLTPQQTMYLHGKRYEAEKRRQGGTGANQHTEQSDQNDHSAKTAERIASDVGVSAPTIRRAATFARNIDTIAEAAGDDARKAILSGEVKLTRDEVGTLAMMAETKPEAVAETITEKANRPHVANNSGNNEWYTPAEYIEAARIVMGGIDLDPASSEIANETVRAEAFYTFEDNGLSKEWAGRVWMNPPYSYPLISEFCTKLVESEKIIEACVLVNNATDTGWFHTLLNKAQCVCFIKGRVRFMDRDGNPSGAPLQGQAVLYFGSNSEMFYNEFGRFGVVLYAR